MSTIVQTYTSDAQIANKMSVTKNSDAVGIIDKTPEITEAIDLPPISIIQIESTR